MKAAIYPRLSDEDRNKKNAADESESIQNQKSMLIEYAAEHNWEIYDIYCDEDWSGADRNRPEFNRLLKDAQARKFDIVLCKSQSRFTRELELVEKYIHGLFPLWGIRFIGVVDNADTDIKGNKKSRQINGLVNEWYLEDLSDSIRSVFDNKRKNGCHIGSFALYGYKKDPDKKGHLIIDEEAAQVVREVFNLFVQGCGKTEIARILNSRGIPNPTEYKRQKGLRYKTPHNVNSTLWRYTTIHYMLINEIYTGTLVQGRTKNASYKCPKKISIPKEDWIRVENTHEAIIPPELWSMAQELISKRTKAFSDTGRIGIFAGKVRCMHCGYIMRSWKHSDGSRYLICATRHASKEACQGTMISVARLEKIVLSEMQTLFGELFDSSYIEKNVRFQNNIELEIKKLNSDIERFEKGIEECSTGIRNLYLDKVKGIINDEEFIDFSKSFHRDRNNYEKFIAQTKEQINVLNKKFEESADKKSMIAKYTDLSVLTRDMVDSFIDYIEIGSTVKGTKQKPVEIHWNF